MRPEILELRRQASPVRRRVDLYERMLMMHGGEDDVVGVRRVWKQTYERGSIAPRDLRNVAERIRGRVPNARPKQSGRIDAAILVLRVGVPALLFVMKQDIGLHGPMVRYLDTHIAYISDKLERGEAHLNHESTVLSIQEFGRPLRQSFLILFLSICKASNPDQLRRVIDTMSFVRSSAPRPAQRYP